MDRSRLIPEAAKIPCSETPFEVVSNMFHLPGRENPSAGKSRRSRIQDSEAFAMDNIVCAPRGGVQSIIFWGPGAPGELGGEPASTSRVVASIVSEFVFLQLKAFFEPTQSISCGTVFLSSGLPEIETCYALECISHEAFLGTELSIYNAPIVFFDHGADWILLHDPDLQFWLLSRIDVSKKFESLFKDRIYYNDWFFSNMETFYGRGQKSASIIERLVRPYVI